jgi:WhiB family redox-sensing transcriptional regulator
VFSTSSGKGATDGILAASRYETPFIGTNRGEVRVAERRYADCTQGWQFDAACRGEDSSLFFAPNYFEKRDEKDRREAKAKAICITCPVEDVCLDFALKIRESHGIWGGLNEFERRQLLRQRTLQAG